MPDGPDELLALALQARRENRLADARQYLVETVSRRRNVGATAELAEALTRLGQIERDMGHNDAALRSYEEAAAIYRARGDALRLAHTVRHVGDIQRNEGNLELAEPCYQEALRIYRSNEKTPPLDLANAIRGFALLKGEAGDAQEARWLWEEAMGLYASLDVKAGVDESVRRLARLEHL
jgi:tetratricopeptide (TPR) repeat protein